MPRRLLKRLCPSPRALESQWFVRLFGKRIADQIGYGRPVDEAVRYTEESYRTRRY